MDKLQDWVSGSASGRDWMVLVSVLPLGCRASCPDSAKSSAPVLIAWGHQLVPAWCSGILLAATGR